MHRLHCEQNAKQLGIELEDGSCDMEVFGRHIRECPACKSFAKTLVLLLEEQVSDEFVFEKMQESYHG